MQVLNQLIRRKRYHGRRGTPRRTASDRCILSGTRWTAGRRLNRRIRPIPVCDGPKIGLTSDGNVTNDDKQQDDE